MSITGKLTRPPHAGMRHVALNVLDLELVERFYVDLLGFAGIIVDQMDQVDQWYEFLLENAVKMASEPRTHRDGARSFYCHDPEGTVVQVIFHPPLSKS